jgi:hypothetical protein
VWLIGRQFDDNLPDDAPVHLGLPGAKPLLGLHGAQSSPTVIVVEGSFDELTLNMWGYPVVATLGTWARDRLSDKCGAIFVMPPVLEVEPEGMNMAVRGPEQVVLLD